MGFVFYGTPGDFEAAVVEQKFCTSGGVSDDDDLIYECSCGLINGRYATPDTGSDALETHLDQQEDAYRAFARAWWAEHDPDTPIHF